MLLSGLVVLLYGLYTVELSYGQLNAYSAPPCAGRQPDPAGSCVIVTVGTVDCHDLRGDACSVLQPGEPVVITRWWGGLLRVAARSGQAWWTRDEPRDAWNRGVVLALAGLALLVAFALMFVHREKPLAPESGEPGGPDSG